VVPLSKIKEIFGIMDVKEISELLTIIKSKEGFL